MVMSISQAIKKTQKTFLLSLLDGYCHISTFSFVGFFEKMPHRSDAMIRAVMGGAGLAITNGV
jgi:hypothetical protein